MTDVLDLCLFIYLASSLYRIFFLYFKILPLKSLYFFYVLQVNYFSCNAFFRNCFLGDLNQEAVLIITLVTNVSQKGLKSVVIIREYTIFGELCTLIDYKLTYKLCSGLPVSYFNST